MSCCYEVIPKPFQGEHVCCNNSCSNQSIEKILSDSFYIYLAWILGKVSATKSKKTFWHWIQNLSTLYQFWYRGPPIFGIGYTKSGIGWTSFGLPYTSSGNTLTVCYLAQLFCQIAFPDILIHPCVMAWGHHPRMVTVTIIHISGVPNPLVGPPG